MPKDGGHTIVLDGPPESGGRNLGIRPMEAMLIGMGGCTAFDVISILKKARQAVTDCVVELEAERAETPPRVFTRIHATYRVTGTALGQDQVERAIRLSTEKYCSATIMLSTSVDISHDYEIIDASA